MRCPHCDYEADHDFKFCPECGTDVRKINDVKDDVPDTMKDGPQEERQNRTAYVRNDYSPERDGRPVTADHNQSQDTSGKKPATTGMIIFSLVNMLCCGFGISMILGIIALIFSIISTSEATWEGAVQKLKIARILNIVGLVFIIIQVIVLAVIIVSMVIFSSETGYGIW